MKDFEDIGQILDCLGSSGKYQKLLLYAILVPMSVLLPIITLAPIFLFYVPNHWCHLVGAENLTGLEFEIYKNKTLPIETGPDGRKHYSQCQMYDSIGEAIKCPDGWDYERNDFVETMASEFNWVCSKSHYSTILFTVIQAGFFTGTIIFGLLADRIGRRPVFFISLSIYLILRFISIFIPQYFIPYLIVIFISSTGMPMFNFIPPMILAEICDDKFRSWFFALLSLIYVGGMASVSYISYFCSHWYQISLVTILPNFLIFLSWFFIPESPRWLIGVGRIKEAVVILRKIAKVNGTLDTTTYNELERNLINISKEQNKDTEKLNIGTLLKKSTMTKHVVLITISWVMSNIIYECITLNSQNMSGDLFLNFSLLAIMEAPSSFVGGYCLAVIGRRWTAVIFFCFSVVCCFIGVAFMSIMNISIVVIVATFVAKFAIKITYLTAYIQATELIPTSLRATGLSFVSSVSYGFALLVPSIVFTATYYAPAPYILMGFVALLAMFTSSFLPETMNQELPETIDAANKFGHGISYWNFSITRRHERIQREILHESTSNTNET